MYEKTPAYYKSHVAPERIKFAKPDIKLITVGKFLETAFYSMKNPEFRGINFCN